MHSAQLAVFIASDKVGGLVLSILGVTVVYQLLLCLPWSPGVGWRGLVPWVPPKTPMSPGTIELTDNSLIPHQGPLEQLSWGILPSHINCLCLFF